MSSQPLTVAQRSMRARIAALSRTAKHVYDPRAALAAANNARWQAYRDQVDPSGCLAPDERDRRVMAAWRADMERARYNASRARSKK